MESTESAPVRIARADFLALTQAVPALYFLALSGWGLLSAGLSVEVAGWFGAAVVSGAFGALLYVRPDSVDRGSDRAPRRWFEVAGVVAGGLLLSVVAGYLLTTAV
ncbi:hypothetical protein [Halogeometricum luteum]|uniref:Uncharacterized protein n=1 Tax=Halogeometricum luteum TaxID=2950537 RepID=A0ABU2FYE6_9EURY|nr:hypothetical protein [Halogeometricum sp. S3BR5-2]MDS0293545.1 hypothetical protein [Halogeometricum sp. S3BR5-2]